MIRGKCFTFPEWLPRACAFSMPPDLHYCRESVSGFIRLFTITVLLIYEELTEFYVVSEKYLFFIPF
jgi:hypothetical protein